jgi:virulence-associated protein VapD
MLDTEEIRGAGFTVIVDDLTAEQRSQESINKLFEDIRKVLNTYGFDLAIVASNEDAMHLQGKLLFTRMFEKLDKLCRED